ncbi:envelope stress response membrane protein PspB [Oleidesulfovibrio sp.]|uniref:envelope stress response membrane protein PspB n=1 Tax=Oleidesulfovibrio sp. TaxID=2909707 RepID=UPI003A84F950
MHSIPMGMFWFMVVPLIAIAIVLVLLLRMLRDRRPGPESEAAMDETRMIQELYRGMNRMEQRVEALETLLLERDAHSGRRQRERMEDE